MWKNIFLWTLPFVFLLVSPGCAEHHYYGSAGSVLDFMERIYGSEDDPNPKGDIHSELSVLDEQPRVQTTSGLIYGAKNEHTNSFFSIPFAVPPVGELRYKSPEILETPDLARNLSARVRNSCVQPGQFNEDCLVLTVHVPKDVDLSSSNSPPAYELPVLVFLHGGAYFFGTGSLTLYDGRYLSQATSAIVVTVNYRLGPLGFLVFDDGEHAFEGNQALRDQQLAMQWVQSNIRNFGGDSNKVTLFGESAGAQSTMFHLLSKTSEPLFHRAIMQSNPAVFRYHNRERALSVTDQLIQLLRCSAINRDDCCGPLKSNYSCLMESSPQALNSAMLRIMGISWVQIDVLSGVEAFRPYIDGLEFTDQPMTLFKEGKWSTNKPVIIGTNEEELVVLKYIIPMNEFIFRGLNKLLFDGEGHNNNTGDLISEKYTELYSASYDDFGHIFGIEMTDIFFGCTSRAMARFASATAKSGVYYYVFSHTLDGQDCEDAFGNFCGYSYHASELYFVFRTIEHIGLIADEEDVDVSNQFSKYWGNMAWTGNPSEGPDFGFEGPFPEWTRYEKRQDGDSWTNMRIDDPNARLETDYMANICDFWDSLGVYEAPTMDLVTDPTTRTPPITESPSDDTTSGSSVLHGVMSIVVTNIAIIVLTIRNTA